MNYIKESKKDLKTFEFNKLNSKKKLWAMHKFKNLFKAKRNLNLKKTKK